MAVEKERGCGFRKVGGLYLVGDYVPVECDRLPYPLTVCPVCGGGIKVGRGFTKINPLQLLGYHDGCQELRAACHMCRPTDDIAYLMNVGARYYTPESFLAEGLEQGISKRIAQIPKGFKVGITVIYLSHPKACVIQEPAVVQQAMGILQEHGQTKLCDADQQTKAAGIFCAFVPQRIERLYWQSDVDGMTEKEKDRLAKRGITPVGIPDGDNDHA